MLKKMTSYRKWGKLNAKRRVNNYVMKINGMSLLITGDENGRSAQYINHLCALNCELVQRGVDGLPHKCFFAKKNITSGIVPI